ncbi:hypothetical protein B0T26DRAFT_173248 [Lasiosphaeria miniovina]|uniref:Uncharacterized protein n=1 Tax=Lasiosphaeria miniovina TaxID=1954250 RepID=A0AA40E520_9PEZI|nr:uncharacterized protein B0T26DRAFT_173248 [Lasiosphaeria miniovina]KAK0728479.1 hypothetical protein B0T26DRAFT_173248 [Lasiosphaeria miniovina]
MHTHTPSRGGKGARETTHAARSLSFPVPSRFPLPLAPKLNTHSTACMYDTGHTIPTPASRNNSKKRERGDRQRVLVTNIRDRLACARFAAKRPHTHTHTRTVSCPALPFKPCVRACVRFARCDAIRCDAPGKGCVLWFRFAYIVFCVTNKHQTFESFSLCVLSLRTYPLWFYFFEEGRDRCPLDTQMLPSHTDTGANGRGRDR